MKLPVGVNCDTNDIKGTVHKQKCNFCRNGLKRPIEPPLQEVTSTKCCLTIENKTYEKSKNKTTKIIFKQYLKAKVISLISVCSYILCQLSCSYQTRVQRLT